MISSRRRMSLAMVIAVLFAGASLAVVQAREGVNAPLEIHAQQSPDCTTCHTEFQMSWQSGPHGQSARDPVFVADWTQQGKPGACLVCHTTGYDPATATWEADNVSCEACHGTPPADHPKTPMPIDRSPDLCGRCHSDTRFGWQDWQGSTHYQRGMNCTTCHDPHSASIKLTVDRSAAGNDVSTLCINCHQEASMNFPYTAHHQQGVACVDCHLEHLEQSDRAAHTVPDHSFSASLQTCNTCHAAQMHADADAVGTGEPASAAILPPQLQTASVTPEPMPVSPLGYASLAGLIGLAAGMVMAPWLEKAYRRAVKLGEERRDG